MNAAQQTQAPDKDFVLGLGATGLSIARYLKSRHRDAAFYDTRIDPPGMGELKRLWPDAELLLGKGILPTGIGRIVTSPGLPDSHPILTAAREAELEIISDIELFAREAKAPFVAVTGSNGKSTVTTLLYHMCRASGRKVLAGGNLGKPALDLLDREAPELYVLELSSFQLQRTRKLPAEVSVLLNVSPDHLDWHRDEVEYRDSKYRVFQEARAAVYNRADKRATETARKFERAVSFGMDAPVDSHYGIRRDGGIEYLARGKTLLIATHELAMIGVHNYANALAAMAAGDLLGLDLFAMLQVLVEFPGLPHRMQLVARHAGISYVNDSKATNVAAAVASIDSVENNIVLIAGGDGKGGDFDGLAAALGSKLRAAVLVGQDAKEIAAALDTMQPVRFADDMYEAVELAAAEAVSGDTVLLAPACASLDQYKSYTERGDAFVKAVRTMAL